MRQVLKVGIRKLKNNLSSYLREMRRGTRILVTDRNAVVAELHEPRADYEAEPLADPVLAEWVREGTVLPATRKKEPLPESPVRLPDGTALRLLDEDRGRRER
jgi:antitoxin (DNA-binding transcriptional repressor) of toxin-antitoxin stability system